MKNLYKTKQNGVVLVSVLIIIGIISLTVSLMWQQQARNLAHTKHIIYANQTTNHLYNIEAWVKSILKKDDVEVDHLEEDWATIIAPIKISNGIIYGKITDLQARFNLNRLISINKERNLAYLNPDYGHCLNNLNVALEQDFMSDFILEYMNQKTPIEQFKHPSQLRQVAGITHQDYLKIKPYLNTSATIKTVNINTASKEVISCLHPDLSIFLAQDIINQRPFNSLSDAQMAIHKVLSGLSLKQVQNIFNPNLISVNSQYFLLESDIQVDSKSIKTQTLFHRNAQFINVVYRTYEQKN